MSDLFDRTLIDKLNDLKQRLANIEAQDTIKRDSSTGLPYFPSLTAGSVLFAGSGGLLSQDNANLFWDDTNNRLGLGTAAPTKCLHLASATTGDSVYMSYVGPSYMMGNNAVFASATMYGFLGLATAAGHYGVAAGDVLLAAQGNSRGNIYINSNYSGTGTTHTILQPSTGNVGIGTTAPTAKLDVLDGYIRARDGANNAPTGGKGIELVATGGVGYLVTYDRGLSAYIGMNQHAQFIDYKMNTVNIARLHSNGLYLGGTATPSKTLEIATDSAGKPTTNTWQIISDARTKRNIRPYTTGFELIRQLNPVHFEYNGKGGTPEGDGGVGVLAQDIEQFAPQMVRRVKAKIDADDDERLEYQGNEVQYAMINAMKEAFDRIAKLEAKTEKNVKP